MIIVNHTSSTSFKESVAFPLLIFTNPDFTPLLEVIHSSASKYSIHCSLASPTAIE
jgi:hypothetical protein